MKPSRALLQSLTPPCVYKALALATHRLLHDATYFSGRYANWAAAAAAADGYDTAEILQRTEAAMQRIQANPTLFERDSVILPEPEYSFPALAALLQIGGQNRGQLDVVDFGGALGSSYFQFRRFLGHLRPLNWAVVEQAHFVERGRKVLHEDGLSFHPTIESALQTMRKDLLFASGVFQYLPDPPAFIEQLIGLGFDYILIDRMAFHEGANDRLTLQRNPAAIYRASYPAWFFCEQRFLAMFSQRYATVYSFAGRDQVHLAGGTPYYRGFLLKRIANLP
jgi:putative methyltransferase (TIGR04325 family)